MTTDRDLERAAARFADTVYRVVTVQVQLAWALERDRLHAEIAELRDDVIHLRNRVSSLGAKVDSRLYSVKVEP
jgi:hypothetical protein